MYKDISENAVIQKINYWQFFFTKYEFIGKQVVYVKN